MQGVKLVVLIKSKKPIVFLLLFINLFASCNNCKSLTKINSNTFKKHIITVRVYEEGKRAVLVDDYRDAIDFLSLVTGIDSKAGYSSTVGYRNKDDYKKDMEAWRGWFKKNRCKLTDQYIDSAFKSVQLQNSKL